MQGSERRHIHDVRGSPNWQRADRRTQKQRWRIKDFAGCRFKEAIPAFKPIESFETALKILPLTSETAEQNLKGPRGPGTHWIVIVGGGGNSFA